MVDFDQFVAARVDDLLRTAYLIVWDEGEAEDLVQECLLKVARRWPRSVVWSVRGPTPGGSWSTCQHATATASNG